MYTYILLCIDSHQDKYNDSNTSTATILNINITAKKILSDIQAVFSGHLVSHQNNLLEHQSPLGK